MSGFFLVRCTDKNLREADKGQVFVTGHPALYCTLLSLDDDDDDDLQRKQRKNTSRKSAKDGRASVRRLHARPACLQHARRDAFFN